MKDTLEVFIRRAHRTLRNMLRANELAESVENHKAFIAALGISHRLEILNLRSSYAAQQLEDRATVDRNDGSR